MIKSIKEARKILGLTQADMATLLGTSQHRISELERGIDGRKPTKQMEHHIAALAVLVKNGLLEELRAEIKNTSD